MEKMCMITDASGSPKGRFYWAYKR
jgi:hypothetical protein